MVLKVPYLEIAKQTGPDDAKFVWEITKACKNWLPKNKFRVRPTWGKGDYCVWDLGPVHKGTLPFCFVFLGVRKSRAHTKADVNALVGENDGMRMPHHNITVNRVWSHSGAEFLFPRQPGATINGSHSPACSHEPFSKVVRGYGPPSYLKTNLGTRHRTSKTIRGWARGI